MPTEMELTLEQTQQGVSYEVSNIRVNLFTMKMEILLESTSNKLMVERFNTSAGNPVKRILLKLNLSDHRLCKMVVECQSVKVKEFQERCNIKAFQEWYEHVGPEVASPQDGKVTRWRRDCAWLMISRCSRSQCQIQVQGTSSIQEVNDHYNIFTRESQEYELKTKDKASALKELIYKSSSLSYDKLVSLSPNGCHKVLSLYGPTEERDDIILDLPRRAFVVEKKRKGFGELMKDKFHMSSIGELTFFMGLQTSRPDIMVAVCAFQVSVSPKLPNLFIFAYTDSDYAGATLDRKSTTGGCQFLGNRLISWQCKKQTVVATSTTEAEYVAAANCCGQVLWIQNQLLDYGYNFMSTIIYIDNTTDLLTKGFDAGRFQYLVSSIGMLNP
ncbi:hypothetical protein Tco_1303448 [Tanacetum coccineum]